MGFFKGRALDTRGTVLVETAITLLPFLILISGAIDTGRAAYAWTTLQYAVHEASRWAVLGQFPPPSQFGQQAASAAIAASGASCDSNCQRAIYTAQRIGDTIESFGLDRNLLEVKMCPAASAPCAALNAGSASEIVVTQGTYRQTMMLHNITSGIAELQLASTAYVRNEPFQ